MVLGLWFDWTDHVGVSHVTDQNKNTEAIMLRGTYLLSNQRAGATPPRSHAFLLKPVLASVQTLTHVSGSGLTSIRSPAVQAGVKPKRTLCSGSAERSSVLLHGSSFLFLIPVEERDLVPDPFHVFISFFKQFFMLLFLRKKKRGNPVPTKCDIVFLYHILCR